MAVIDEQIQITPTLDKRSRAYGRFVDICGRLSELQQGGPIDQWVNTIEAVRRDAITTATTEFSGMESIVLRASVSAICDLAAQEWNVSTEGGLVTLRRPKSDDLSMTEEKERIRRGLLVERELELRTENVQAFLHGMEKKRLYEGRWVSIFDLMRDGPSLAEKLAEVSRLDGEEQRAEALADIIHPYLQFADTEARCEFTGLKLIDVWRYFRYTWSSVYKTTPGRTILVLVRDAAVPKHPVIGISALSSAVVQQTVRDNWIGWSPSGYLSKFETGYPVSEARWVLRSLADMVKDVYKEDFFRQKLLRKKDLKLPLRETIEHLHELSKKARGQHFRYPGKSDQRLDDTRGGGSSKGWIEKAESPLFVSKRADLLARLLQAQLIFNESRFGMAGKAELSQLLKSAKVKGAIATVVREAKASHVGIDLMAINVCGAIPPYASILGGKLVAMLMASPEIVSECGRRYGSSISIIASAVCGRAIQRVPRLVLLETTSLYGIASSQYNRLKIPLRDLGVKSEGSIQYLEFQDRTEGYGSFHFSKETVDTLNDLQAQANQYRKVNSIFGEGVSPRLRKIRDGLAEAGLPADKLLLHGSKRIVYALQLAKNFRDVLIGKSKRPKYLLPQSKPKETTRRIISFWRKRWLAHRIMNENILLDMKTDSLEYPIRHRARVRLPQPQLTEGYQEVLFPE